MTTRLHVKLLDGQMVSVEVDCDTQSVSQVLAAIVGVAQAAGHDGPQQIGRGVGEELRLVFAGRNIAGDRTLAAYNLDQESELHLMLRLPLDPHAELRAALAEPACGALSGFTDFVKIGGRDITTMGGGRAGSASQHGACSCESHRRLSYASAQRPLVRTPCGISRECASNSSAGHPS